MKRADLIIRKAGVPDRIANGSVQVVHDWMDSMWRAPSLPCVVSLSEHLSLRKLEQRHEKLKMIQSPAQTPSFRAGSSREVSS